jgi:hypothetical protein
MYFEIREVFFGEMTIPGQSTTGVARAKVIVGPFEFHAYLSVAGYASMGHELRDHQLRALIGNELRKRALEKLQDAWQRAAAAEEAGTL